MVGARVTVPIHWGVLFPHGLHRVWPQRLSQPPLEFARHVNRAGRTPMCGSSHPADRRSSSHDPGMFRDRAGVRGWLGPPRGLLVIQLDGAGADVLRLALRRGPMPTLTRLLEQTHRLVEWTAGVPAQTSSSQAAILYGDDFDIPAFRWYEKEHRRLMVSNHPGGRGDH